MAERAMTDPDLKQVAMVTEDGVEIKVNTILYRTKWKNNLHSEYTNEKDKRCHGDIEALRVFYVNNTHRQFRVRCVRGCEEIFKISDGCKLTRLFGTLKSAQTNLGDQMRDDQLGAVKKINKWENCFKQVEAEKKRLTKEVKAGKIKLPAAV